MKEFKSVLLEAILSKPVFMGKIVYDGKEFQVIENDPKNDSVVLKSIATNRKKTVKREVFDKMLDAGDVSE